MKTEKTFLEHLPPDQLVPIETVAHYTGLPRRTISRYCHGKHVSGRKLAYYDFGKREKRFKVRDIIEFVEDLRR